MGRSGSLSGWIQNFDYVNKILWIYQAVCTNMFESIHIQKRCMVHTSGGAAARPRDPGYRMLQWSDLSHLTYMTAGAMCEIYSAELDGVKVAVKVPRKDCEEPAVAEHDLEVGLGCRFARVSGVGGFVVGRGVYSCIYFSAKLDNDQ